MASPISYDLQGQGGGVVITSSSGVVAGPFRWIQVINDAVFSSIESSNINGIIGLYVTLPAGLGFGGKFTNIGVTSGVVIAYFE